MTVYLKLAERAAAASYLYHTVLLLDVSGSMEQGDWPPSRLAGAVQAANRLIDVKVSKYPDDQIGIVTFSNIALVRHAVAPVRHNATSLRDSLTQIGTGSCTALTDGLITAVTQLSEGLARPVSSSTGVGGACAGGITEPLRQIIVLTDGEHNEGPDPVPYAMEAKRAGFVFDVVGIGTPAALNQTCLKAIASPRLDGSPRYCFIGDAQELAGKLSELAHHYIQPM